MLAVIFDVGGESFDVSGVLMLAVIFDVRSLSIVAPIMCFFWGYVVVCDIVLCSLSSFVIIDLGAQWFSGRVLDSRPKGRGLEPHRRHCVVVLEQDTFILA